MGWNGLPWKVSMNNTNSCRSGLSRVLLTNTTFAKQDIQEDDFAFLTNDDHSLHGQILSDKASQSVKDISRLHGSPLMKSLCENFSYFLSFLLPTNHACPL